MELGLTNKTALVAGASRGIGKAIAQALAHEGAQVFLVARGQADLDQAQDELRRAGGKVATLSADLATESGAKAAVDACLAAFGAVDVLVNNAGGSLGTGPFDVATGEDWRRVLDLNLLSAVWCSQAAVGWMKAHGGGAIVHVSSICGREYCTSAAYSAAKAAMIGMSKEMATDLARHSIRVNAVAPGSILFPGGSWDRRQQKDPGRIQQMIDTELPWHRFGTPEEVASVVAFLCSARASWMSGACVVVDGAQGRAF